MQHTIPYPEISMSFYQFIQAILNFKKIQVLQGDKWVDVHKYPLENQGIRELQAYFTTNTLRLKPKQVIDLEIELANLNKVSK